MPNGEKSVQPPVIVVPGITATGLEDFYPIPPEEVWTAVLRKHYDRISLHPDDLRYEAMEPARIQPRQPFELIYEDLVDALRFDLSPKRELPTPVFLFAYDWRQDGKVTSRQLGDFVVEVLERTRLLPHYRAADGNPLPGLRVDLVGHSMGGMIIADYLARPLASPDKKEKNVRRVVTIATPFQGSVDALAKVTMGKGSFTGRPPRDRERESARTLPALYQLLPTFRGAVTAAPGTNYTLFDPDSWQPSILETLGEYIKRFQARKNARALLSEYLEFARVFRDMGNGLTLKDALPEGKDGWMPIVGVGSPTRQAASIIKDANGNPRFDVGEPQEGWEKDHTSTVTGDGTVPFLGACPAENVLERDRLVCVSPDEFEFLEIKDRGLAKLAGFHAALPTVNLVQRLTLRFLKRDFGGGLKARPAPGVATPKWPGLEDAEILRK